LSELHSAAYHGELDWVQNCLRGGLDPNQLDDKGWTPLHWAAFMGLVDGEREAVVAELIRAGADVNATGPHGDSVLQVALQAENWDIVRQLQDAGAQSLSGEPEKAP
jgi:ankyrin repeat protein